MPIYQLYICYLDVFLQQLVDMRGVDRTEVIMDDFHQRYTAVMEEAAARDAALGIVGYEVTGKAFIVVLALCII